MKKRQFMYAVKEILSGPADPVATQLRGFRGWPGSARAHGKAKRRIRLRQEAQLARIARLKRVFIKKTRWQRKLLRVIGGGHP